MQKEKVSFDDLIIEEVEKSSTNDWEELCNECSSIVKEAKMTENDIDEIVSKVRNGIV